MVEQVEAVLSMFAVMAGLALAAPRLRVPYPVLLVIGGVGVALLPGTPRVRIDPDVVLFVFLPPLLYAAAIRMRVDELRANARELSLLAIGLVLVTTVSVAVVAKELVSTLSWPAAFVLGAVVSPPDPVAAVAVSERLGLPQRVRLLLQAEGAFNDATALVVYRVAVAAVLTAVSVGGVAVQFVVAGAGGILVGLAVGWIGSRLLGWIADAAVENAMTVMLPYLAYLLGEWTHGSGVLCVLVAGLYLARRERHVITSRARLQGQGLWDMIVFALEGFAFLLIGIHLHEVMSSRGSHSVRTLVVVSLAVVVTAVAVRLAWVAAVAVVGRAVGRANSRLSRPETVFVGWAGMRGLVTMAAVLGLPLVTSNGHAFPERQLIVFVAFSVIAATLLVQGVTLPFVARRLGLEQPVDVQVEELRARTATALAALAWLDSALVRGELSEWQVSYLRNHYVTRLDDIERFSSFRDDVTASSATFLARRELLDAERRELERLRREEGLGSEAYGAVRRALDADEARMDRLKKDH